jgi:ABC-type Fe3+ transport system permease subunit
MSTRTSPKIISLKTDPSIFNAKPTTQNANLNAVVSYTTTTEATNPETPWSWWSAILWAIFVLGFALVVAGFFKALTDKNTPSDGTNKDKPWKHLAIAMLIIGFVICVIPFIISIITGIRMF